MLYIVLALVLAAFGLLIAALTTANTIWAWISVTISVVAAAMLIADWVSARRRSDSASTPAKAAATTRAPSGTATSAAERSDTFEPVRAYESEPESPAEQTVQQAAVPQQPAQQAGQRPAPPPPDQEPEEEQTDASDLLVVSELTVEVRVVDERPRYHLDTCGWLADRPTLPLPVNEARQLGFTPCAHCGPDAILAARHRAAR